VVPTYRILIADDDPTIRRLVRLTILPAHYNLFEAADGDAAWSLLQTHRPAVAILDIRMPGRDGLALTRAIRADPRLALTRVILLSGLTDSVAIAEGYAAGAHLYMTKPFWPLQLVATLDAWLGSAE
jgi:DNA-binding response OmpR family regulator